MAAATLRIAHSHDFRWHRGRTNTSATATGSCTLCRTQGNLIPTTKSGLREWCERHVCAKACPALERFTTHGVSSYLSEFWLGLCGIGRFNGYWPWPFKAQICLLQKFKFLTSDLRNKGAILLESLQLQIAHSGKQLLFPNEESN